MITIVGYNFDGPYVIGTEIINRAGIYAILNISNRIVDIGQSGETGTRLANHDRKYCWDRNGGNKFAILWLPSTQYSKEDREKIELHIRCSTNPPCGDR